MGFLTQKLGYTDITRENYILAKNLFLNNDTYWLINPLKSKQLQIKVKPLTTETEFPVAADEEKNENKLKPQVDVSVSDTNNLDTIINLNHLSVVKKINIENLQKIDFCSYLRSNTQNGKFVFFEDDEILLDLMFDEEILFSYAGKVSDCKVSYNEVFQNKLEIKKDQIIIKLKVKNYGVIRKIFEEKAGILDDNGMYDYLKHITSNKNLNEIFKIIFINQSNRYEERYNFYQSFGIKINEAAKFDLSKANILNKINKAIEPLKQFGINNINELDNDMLLSLGLDSNDISEYNNTMNLLNKNHEVLPDEYDFEYSDVIDIEQTLELFTYNFSNEYIQNMDFNYIREASNLLVDTIKKHCKKV